MPNQGETRTQEGPDTCEAVATTPSPLRAHPAAELFPLMSEERLEQLAQSIREHGQRSPVVLCDGLVLDGRNRWLACKRAGVTPRTIEWDGVGSPWLFVWDQNGQRRDLPADQRVALCLQVKRADESWRVEHERQREQANHARSEAQKIAVARQPRDDAGKLAAKPSAVSCDTALGEAPRRADGAERERDCLAAEAGASPATAGRVLAIANSRPDLFEQVASGAMTVTEATRVAKREHVSARCGDLPKDQAYRVIYADPPWQYRDTRAGLAGYAGSAAADHYPTMSVAELCALEVRALADDDAVLFCWATSPLLPDALAVIKAWGFTFKTFFVWAKGRPNFGHYHDASAELLIVATRGSCLPDADRREHQVQPIERPGRHSEKPEHFREMIDRLYPHGRRIELFRRGDVPERWDTWGNEAVTRAEATKILSDDGSGSSGDAQAHAAATVQGPELPRQCRP